MLDAASILETLAETAPITKSIVLLTEYVRQASPSKQGWSSRKIPAT